MLPPDVETIPSTNAPSESYGYARVSTEEQVLGMQVDALVKAGVPEANIFVEKVSSAKKRPELDRLLKEIRGGDVLHVWKLDRLARSVSDLLNLMKQFEERKIGFKSLTEQLDTTSAMGRLVFHVLAAFAQFERDLTRERTQTAIDRLKAQGVHLGRKPKLGSSELKAMERDLKNLHLSIHAIAQKYGVADSTVHSYFPQYRTKLLAAKRHK